MGWDDILGKAITFTTTYDSKPQWHTCGLARKDKLKGKSDFAFLIHTINGVL